MKKNIDKKKILMVLLGERVAGAEQHVFMVLPELVKLGYDVNLLNFSIKNKNNISDEYQAKISISKNLGVNIFHYSLRNKFDYFSLKGIAKLISDICPDIVHTHMIYGDLFGAIAAKIAKVPMVVSTRHYDYSFSLKEIIKATGYYLLLNPFFNKVICVSEKISYLLRKFERLSSGKIFTVPLGYNDVYVNKEEYRKKIVKELGVGETFLIGTVARLIKIKGINYAVKTAKILKENGYKFKWLIIGEGPEKEKLMRYVKINSLENEVIFLGYRSDINGLMSSLDLLVHPSLADSFGLVILEAMIQSTPVVASDIGALREIIVNNSTGILVRPRDPVALAQGIIRLIKNSKERLEFGSNGRQRFTTHFTIDRMMNSISEIYNK